MAVQGVERSDSVRMEQLKAERSAENAKVQERRRQDDGSGSSEVRRVAEEGRGAEVDIAV
jgi:hypothetical protein